jgi:hypothetical protein
MRCAQVLDAIGAFIPVQDRAAFADLCAVMASQRPANPEGAEAASTRWIARQFDAHDRKTRIRHSHADPAQGLALPGLPLFHCNTWVRSRSAIKGNQLRDAMGRCRPQVHGRPPTAERRPH